MTKRIDYINEARTAISKKQQHEIYMLYKSASRALYREQKRLSHYTNVSNSERLKQIDELRSKINAYMNQIANGTYNATVSGIEDMSNVVSTILLKNDSRLGFSSSVVNALVTGSVYGGNRNWNLSSAIWGDNSKKLHDIYNIIARELVLGSSVEQMADKIAKYVNPDYLFYWDGPDGVKVFSHKVDYNSQRLVRTLITHAYQQSIVSITSGDDRCIGYRWHSQGPRACPICQDRDGTLYDKGNVPFDHPNGMCTIEPVYDMTFSKNVDYDCYTTDEDVDEQLDSLISRYLK